MDKDNIKRIMGSYLKGNLIRGKCLEKAE